MCLRYLHQAWLAQVATGSFRSVAPTAFLGYCAAAFVALVAVKILLGLGLHVYASAVQPIETPSSSPAPSAASGCGGSGISSGGEASPSVSPGKRGEDGGPCAVCGAVAAGSSGVCAGESHGRPQLAQHSPLSALGAPEKVHDIFISSSANSGNRVQHASSSSTARRDFMQELAGIERYKVHKGRMI
jgi:hypothetical protein